MKRSFSINPLKWPRRILVVVTVVVLVLVSVGVVRKVYHDNLKPLNRTSQQTLTVTIPQGSSLKDTAQLLKKQNIIKSSWAFERYVRNRKGADEIKAGTYELSPSQDVSEIVAIITEGKVASNLITILPGRRLDQIKKTFANAGYSKSAIAQAFDPDQYKGHPALSDKPANASLEGYLYPESFQKTADTKPETIVRASLDEMQKRLTPELRDSFVKQGLNVHQAITLASIIEQEASRTEDRAIVAQVFLKRLREGMLLQSDVTAIYGAILDGQSPENLHFDSPYNTHLHQGLPPGPISNVTLSSLQAVANPAGTDYLYFVAGDDGKTYFAHTFEEHQANVDTHCKKLCGQTNQ